MDMVTLIPASISPGRTKVEDLMWNSIANMRNKETVCLRCLLLQSLFISILSGAGVIKSTEDGKNLQNFLITVEMLPASIFMLYAFPYTDYKASGAVSCSLLLSFGKALCCVGHLKV